MGAIIHSVNVYVRSEKTKDTFPIVYISVLNYFVFYFSDTSTMNNLLYINCTLSFEELATAN